MYWGEKGNSMLVDLCYSLKSFGFIQSLLTTKANMNHELKLYLIRFIIWDKFAQNWHFYENCFPVWIFLSFYSIDSNSYFIVSLSHQIIVKGHNTRLVFTSLLCCAFGRGESWEGGGSTKELPLRLGIG